MNSLTSIVEGLFSADCNKSSPVSRKQLTTMIMREINGASEPFPWPRSWGPAGERATVFVRTMRIASRAGARILPPGVRAVHDVKIDTEPFDAVLSGMKTHEFRKNDRDYRVGDEMYLQEHVGDVATGRTERVRITYITYGPNYGIPQGYCAMSVRRT